MELNFTSYFQYKPFRMTQIKRHNLAYDEIICKVVISFTDKSVKLPHKYEAQPSFAI